MEHQHEELVVQTSRALGKLFIKASFVWIVVVTGGIIVLRDPSFAADPVWWKWFVKWCFKWFILTFAIVMAVWIPISSLCALLTGLNVRADGIQLFNPLGSWASLEYDEIRYCASGYKGDGDFEHEVDLYVSLCTRGWKPPIAAPVHGIVSSLFGCSPDGIHMKPDWEDAIPFLKTLKAHDVKLVPEELDEDIEAVLEAEESEGSGSA